MLKTSAANLFLRSLTLVSKFVLLLFVAARMLPEDLGVFGLFSVTVVISLYLLGMDFYVFNTREILARDEAECLPLIRDQVVFHALTYVIILPLLSTVFLTGLISWKYLGWFYLILVLEHLSQEAGRLLITLSRPTMANAVLFVRSGIWVYVVLAMGYLWEGALSLTLIWSFWSLGALASLTLAARALRHLPWKSVLSISVDWGWLRLGLKGSLPFFGSTVALLGIQYADRYFLQNFHGEAMVGVYTFFANIANLIQVFIYTGVIMILYPRIVSAYQKQKMSDYRVLMRRMALGVTGGVVILSVLAALGIGPLLYLVDKEIYSNHMSIFWIMLGTVTLLTLSHIPHYALYVRRYDRAIIGSTVLSLVVAVTANALWVPGLGVRGAAWATFAAMVTLCLAKYACLWRVRGRGGMSEDDEVQRGAVATGQAST
ncbi:MAG: hypothetical protein OEW00_14670 [candidate division Zixibacteria bacterium]|nr:hypothetical protein [candidate division Zixibacteria bacterium]